MEREREIDEINKYPCLRDLLPLGMPAILTNANKALDGDEVHPHALVFRVGHPLVVYIYLSGQVKPINKPNKSIND